MARWKVLPHRLRDGRCRDCGTFDARRAPRTCPRCALERYADEDCSVLANPVAAFDAGYEQWRIIAGHLCSGRIKSGSFYLYVSHDDGEPMGPPLGDLDPGDWQHTQAPLAHELALALRARYPRTWVVTTVGCWTPAH